MQLPLDIVLRESASLDAFQPGRNREVVAAIRACAEGRGESFLYLWGRPGSGRSHLLQGACRLASEQGLAVAYLPLGQGPDMPGEILAGLGELALVCLDDIHAITGRPAWERGIFHLFNRLRGRDARLLVSADRPPAGLPLTLPDLKSRLGWGLTYQLQPLNDEEKLEAMTAAARRRGMELPAATARYILRRAPRDMGSLLEILSRLDRASLAAQRRLTVPFVAEVLTADQPSSP
ncbi:MAG TPA: DnaA regulatory inactivator Hda [Sedimenticola sp.]|nr:DnaA regulatory inactivator Hda [Sedimenticola sp.]